MPRFAANLSMMFNELPLLDRFAAASQAGFTAVEYLIPYDYPAELVDEALRAAGVRQALFNLPPGDWSNGERGLAALPERKAEFRASVETAVRYGRAIGTPLLHMMAGIADGRDPAARAAYLDALEFAADGASIGVVIEPINARDMPGYLLDDFERAAEIVAEVGRIGAAEGDNRHNAEEAAELRPHAGRAGQRPNE